MTKMLIGTDSTGAACIKITKGNINVGIMKYHAKQAQLEVEKEKAKNARANG